MIAGMITTTIKAQYCGGPVPVISIYTTLDRSTDLGIGGEIGSMNEDSRWSYFGGVLLSIKTPETLKREKEISKPGETVYRQDLSVYMKGSFRLYKSDQSSFHAVSSVELNMRSQLDIKAGMRILLPVTDRVALSAEPVYSYRKRDVTGRIGLVIGL